MEWNESFESGLADIDVQHRYLYALIERVNELHDGIALPENRALGSELVSFAMCHFACEEQLMTAYGYPGISKHVQEHAKLLLEVRRYQDTEVLRPRELGLFLCNWVVAHTLLEDRALGQHVIQRRAELLGISVNRYMSDVVTEYRPSGTTRISRPRDEAANE